MKPFNTPIVRRRLVVVGCRLSFMLLAGWRTTALADEVLSWNEVTSDVMLANEHYQNPGMASRTVAMVNVALHDAIHGISQEYPTFYSHSISPSAGASREAAAAAAAHSVLSAIYPDQQSMLDTALAASLAGISDEAARNAGQMFGNGIGAAVVSHRAGDGFDHMVPYTPKDQPGKWTADPLNPTQEAWGPQWGGLSTFALRNPAAYLPPPMPDMASPEYAAAFNEVKELGEVNSTSRTAEQTEIGLFWAYDRVGMGTPMRLYNSVLRTIAAQEGNNLSENARLFALTSVAVADAGIVAWDAKFIHDFWRPVTGIREADLDGNQDTEADPDWTPLGAPGGGVVNDFTPPFPTYISGHATFGGALFQSIANFYGTDEIAFTLTSDELPGVTRSYTRLSDAMAENGRSRVYLGIHWNFDDLEGRLVGGAIADAIFAGPFVAVPEPTTALLLALVGAGFAFRRVQH